MTIQELEQKLNECQKELAELKESKKEGKWLPKEGEEYWFRDDEGDVVKSNMHREYDWNVWRENNFPIFETKEACERYWHFMDTVKEKSYEFSREEWEDENINKYIIAYCNHIKDISVSSMNHYNTFGEIHFKTEEDAQYIIDNFKDELMEYFL